MAVGLTLSSTPTESVAQSPPPEALDAVVRIESVAISDRFAPSAGQVGGNGAGIVVGALTDSSVLVATARHVAARKQRIDIYFRWDPETPRPASVKGISTDLDVALLEVEVDTAAVRHLRGSFDRRGRSDVETGSPVYPVGCPDGVCWTFPSPADQVLSSAPLVLDFQSTFASGGNSGGALFDEDWEIVGMVIRNDPPRAAATPIAAVLDEVEMLAATAPQDPISRQQWTGMSRMKQATIPRGGYGWTLGVTILYALDTPDITAPNGLLLDNGFDGGRAPSGRMTLERRGATGWAYHFGALRLAPPSVATTAAIAGLARDFRTPNGRVLFRPFVEGAAGRTESRYDSGGYLAGGSEYVPAWVNEERDGLGFGAGAAIAVTLFSRTILDGTIGGWRFSAPENAPGVPFFYAGFGLRIGV